MLYILREIIAFIKNPKDERVDGYSITKNIKYLVVIFCFDLILNILVLIPILYLLDKAEPLISEIRINYHNNTFSNTLLFVAVLAPIIEELLFRSWLRFNKLFALFINRSKWDKIFKYLVYTSILLFGFIHSSNYINHSLFFYLIIPILVATQTIGGLLFTFIRVKFNLISSIILHCLWNASILLFTFFNAFFEKPYSIDDENYSLKIEFSAFNTNEPQKYNIDTAANRIYKITTREYSINHILDSLFKHERYAEDYLINIDFESKEGLDIETFKDLLLDYDKKK